MIRLRPPLPARLINANVALVLWLPALWVIGGEAPLPPWLGLVLVGGGCWLCWRGYRLGADCADGTVIVRGYLRDRTIRCSAVTHLDRGPVPDITWVDARGRTRSTRLDAFRQNLRRPSFDQHHAKNLVRLRDYVKKHRRRA